MSAGLLAGRAALVTGGARGLGAAIARTYAGAGARGAVLDLEPAEAPGGWLSLTADVADDESVGRATAEAAARLGRLDVVVANAGIVPPWTETAELDGDELDRVHAVNVRGVALTLKHAARALRERGGSIVVMASLNSRRAHPSQHVYTASKHAALGLVRSAALDLGRYGIRVNAVGPGPVATAALLDRMARRAADGGLPLEDALAEAGAGTALRRMVTEGDVAGAALFLASDLAAGITGVLLPVDAGLG